MTRFKRPGLKTAGCGWGSAIIACWCFRQFADCQLKSMEKIQAFAKAGGKVIAIRETPTLCYGWHGWREKSARVREIASQVFGSGGGRVVADESNSLLRALRDSHPPDIDFQTADPEVGFVHRRTPEHEFYFVANTSAVPKRLQAVFRVGRRRPQVWDPLTGRTQQVEDYAYERGGTSMPIVVGPYASTIIAFGKAAPAPSKSRTPQRTFAKVGAYRPVDSRNRRPFGVPG